MRKSIRVTALAAVIGVALAGGLVSSPLATAQSSTAATVQSYIITFNEPGLLYYTGGVSSLEATAPSVKGQRKLDSKSPAAVAYSNYLSSIRADRVNSISSAVGRSVSATHHYAVTLNGIAAELSAAEADAVRRLPGVKSVQMAALETLDTYRGPSFIGADTVWNGTNVPGGTGTRGFGVTLGVVDGGTNSDHPSFANDASCGFSAGTPKLISFVDCSTTSGTGACNGPNPEATDSGHGVHTSSTAAGNTLTATTTPPPTIPAPFTSISGVAPCASIRHYKACPDNTCPEAQLTAALQNAIADGVDVINYSISGGRSPWTDFDRTFLDAVNADIVVAASAGNTSATVTNPVGNVNHLGPWTMTVAASTHDENVLALFSLAGPGTPPANTVDVSAVQGSTTPIGSVFTNQPIRSFPANLEACTAGTAIPAGHFTGAVAYVRRGTCSFTEKITNAVNAGAIFVLVGNNQAGTISMATTGAPTTVPAYSVSQVSGDAIRDFVAANPATATANFDPRKKGDVLAGFSLRGPTIAGANVTKPDITGPGVQIYAALADASSNYGFLSGTSMSSPHLAGSAVLVRAAKPGWTPMEVKSALQLTAKITGFDDNATSPWDPDDVGNGRVDLTKAIKAALTMNETYANFVAANPSGGSIAARTLNLPSMRDDACNGSCSFTRTMTSKVASGTTWTATYVPLVSAGAPTVTITPANFTVVGGGTQALTIAVNMGYGATAAVPMTFGHVVLTPSDNSLPVERLTLSVAGTRDGIFTDNFGTPPPTVTVVQGFDDITTIAGLGWLTSNNSVPVGTTPGWFQGNPAVFTAQAGAATSSYIGAHFNNVAGDNTITNWLVTPLMTFNAASSVNFWTRSTVATDGVTVFPDRLEVRVCTTGACTAISPDATALTTFPTVIRTINPNLTTTDDPTGVNGYPLSAWAQFTLDTGNGLPSTGQGRIAFRYWVTSGGPNGANSNFIGIDTVTLTAGSVNSTPVPEGGAGITPPGVSQTQLGRK
ncbi:MAG: S8 family serine peptidase [Rhodanobacteraceae bacterium]|nr:S8 family serine peptidase [Rhodanobacteraceae bacterium]